MATLMRWSPFGGLLSLPREMERVLDWDLPWSSGGGESRMLVPTMDVMYRDSDMVVRMQLPGMKEDEIDIGMSEDVLTISGEHKEENVTERDEYVLRESRSGRFERQVMLPRGVDAETIQANFHDGVLEVTIPKAKELEEPTVRHIPIAAEATTGPQPAMQSGTQGGAEPGMQASVERGMQAGKESGTQAEMQTDTQTGAEGSTEGEPQR